MLISLRVFVSRLLSIVRSTSWHRSAIIRINQTMSTMMSNVEMTQTAILDHASHSQSLPDDNDDSDDSFVKMEEDDDEDYSSSSGPASILRNLQHESENRDSPNSSLTSVSTASSVTEQKVKVTVKQEVKPETPEKAIPYMFLKAPATCRAKSSIPSRLSPSEYANQCVAAAEASRLNPYALHEDEHKLLQDKLCYSHVTVYLNIRNGILRLWTRNPSVSVTLEEAIGCARDERWTRLACFAYEWLLRRGYINFGCVEPAAIPKATGRGRKKEPQRETIVVIGGGVAGLSTARQLTNLFHHYPDRAAPRIIVLEGRDRIGGRIYSHPLTSMRTSKLAPGQRPTAEMGAHIIVGFERGNPLDAIVRGQLALDYHLLRDLSTLYDIDGTPVNGANDAMIERLYNDILDRTGHYRLKHTVKKTAQGDKDYIDAGRDPPDEESITIKQYEEATALGTIDQLLPKKKSRRRGAGHRAAKGDKSSEEVDTNMDTKMQLPAAQAAKEFGFMLRKTTQMHETLELDDLARQLNQSLGAVMDAGVDQYQQFLDLKPYALRLLNWHFANLEYANAANVDKLSLRGWDQDIGNEFEGEHAQVVGGYQQVPRALWRHPEPLDVRTRKVVKSIKYSAAGSQTKATVTCEDGQSIEADRVVFTAPLGVLKNQSIQFDPPLPQWKRDAIRRMGFGLLNKVVLVFERPFWDVHRDMFGLLRGPRNGPGLQQSDYKEGRGQFYLFWNCIETTGLPVLIALMAGEAAHEAEKIPDEELVGQCLGQLRNVFGPTNVPMPIESIVTRWGSDRFARGTYSFVAAEARPGDYDLIAAPIQNLFFAGEATIATHPATVHGLSKKRTILCKKRGMLRCGSEFTTTLAPRRSSLRNSLSMLFCCILVSTGTRSRIDWVESGKRLAERANIRSVTRERTGDEGVGCQGSRVGSTYLGSERRSILLLILIGEHSSSVSQERRRRSWPHRALVEAVASLSYISEGQGLIQQWLPTLYGGRYLHQTLPQIPVPDHHSRKIIHYGWTFVVYLIFEFPVSRVIPLGVQCATTEHTVHTLVHRRVYQ
ncbi:hypothetical protein KCU88_g277, partial [Aureobasidium melanogenum]